MSEIAGAAPQAIADLVGTWTLDPCRRWRVGAALAADRERGRRLDAGRVGARRVDRGGGPRRCPLNTISPRSARWRTASESSTESVRRSAKISRGPAFISDRAC